MSKPENEYTGVGEATVSRVRRSRGETPTREVLDAIQNALAVAGIDPLLEFTALCRVAEELQKKYGLAKQQLTQIEGTTGQKRKQRQAKNAMIADLREIFDAALPAFGAASEMGQNLEVLAWEATAGEEDASAAHELLMQAARDERLKADSQTPQNAAEWIKQRSLSEWIADALNAENEMEQWEITVRQTPQKAQVLDELESYVAPRDRRAQPDPPEPPQKVPQVSIERLENSD